LVNSRNGDMGAWVFPPFRWKSPEGVDYRAIDSRLYPASEVYEAPYHPVGYPLLIAALIAPLHPSRKEVEQYTGFAMGVLGWFGALLTYLLARRAGLSREWSLAAPCLLVLASPWLAYSRSFFPEVPIGVAILLAFHALLRNRPFLSGLAIAAAAFMKPNF